MSSTPNRSYPYPTLFAAPDVPADIAALAIAIDTDMQAQVSAVKPGQLLARMTRAATGTIASGAPIPWDAASYNPNGSWVVGAPTRFTATVAGYHRFGVHAHHGVITSGTLVATSIRANGSTVVSTASAAANSSPSGGTSIPFDDVVLLAVGQYVEILISNANAAAINAATSVLTVTYAGA